MRETQRGFAAASFSDPVVVSLIVVLLLAARWIWVAGLGDYGWEYDIAERILHGAVFFRDFVLLRGPLSYYTLAACLRVAGHHLFIYHLHLWLSYGLCLAASLLLLRQLDAPKPSQVAGMSLAAVVACPVFTWGHALDYLAPFLATVAILAVLRAREGNPNWALLAGAASALAIFHKQNIGIAIALCIPLFLGRRSLALYLAGFLPAFAATFWVFASRAGAGEVWRQMFTDAASTKGGFLFLALRSIPRVIFRPDLPMRRTWEAAATLLAYCIAAPLAIHVLHRHAEGTAKPGGASLLGPACIAGAGLGVAMSLTNFEAVLPERIPIQPWVLLMELFYIFFFLVCAVYCAGFAGGGKASWRTALLLALAVTAAQEASDPNFAYSAPLVVPLLCALLPPAEVASRAPFAGVFVAAVYLLGTTIVGPVAYYGMCAYHPTYPLPPDSPFSGLRAPHPYAQLVEEYWQNVRPAVKNRRTLWITGGWGPYSAFGGSQVFTAPYSGQENLSARLEQRLIQRWQEHPPGVVIMRSDFQSGGRSQVLNASYIRQNVLTRYADVWRSKADPLIEMWVRPGADGGPAAPGDGRETPGVR